MHDLTRPEAQLGEREPDGTAEDNKPPPERLESTPAFGRSAVASGMGSAMLGLEQALRSQPPPEVMVGEHQLVRGLSGRDGDLVLVFPDEPDDAAEDETRPPRG